MKILFPIILLFLTLFFSCKKKEQPELLGAQNACDCIEETSADFLIEEMTDGNENFARYTETDSIFHSKNVRFTAKIENAEYKWFIGAEILTSKTYARYFDQNLIGSNIPITLVVKNKKINNECFPNDDGYDTVTKYLYVTNFPVYDWPNLQVNHGLTEGTFRVKSDHLPDSFDITVDVVATTTNGIKNNIYNYDGLGSNCLLQSDQDFNSNYRELFFIGGTSLSSCENLGGSLWCKSINDIEFNLKFTYQNSSGQVYDILRQYKGRKL